MSCFYTSCLNFHVVEEGKLYRSAQPSKTELQEIVRKYKIKTVVDLRGYGDYGKLEKWFLDEQQVTSENNILILKTAINSW